MNEIVQQKAKELTFQYFSEFRNELESKNISFEEHITETMEWDMTLENFIDYEIVKLSKTYEFQHYQFGINEEETKLISKSVGRDLLNGIRKEYIYEIDQIISEEMKELNFLKQNKKYLLEKKDLLEPNKEDHFSDEERAEAIAEDQQEIENLEQEIIKKQMWKKGIQKAELLVCA